MARWIHEPDLQRGEEVLWSQHANREQDSFRQAGGRLFITDRRIVFVPGSFDKASGGRPWEAPLDQVAVVTVEPRRFTAPLLGLAARLRRRLRLELRDGSVELFVVNGLERLVGKVSGAADLRNGR